MQLLLLLLVGLLVLIAVVNSQDDRLSIEFVFPKHGETLIIACDVMGICTVDIIFGGYIKNRGKTDGPCGYSFTVQWFESNATAHMGTTLEDIINSKLTITVSNSTVTLPIMLQVANCDSGEILYESHRTLVLVTPSDYGINSLNSISHFYAGGVDFIELGTSNFDTVSQAAAALLSSGAMKSVTGIAVEVLIQYLAVLPKLDGVQKINAGMTTSAVEEMVPVYYIPESIIDKLNLGLNIKGCTSVNIVDVHIMTQIAWSKVPPEAVFKAYVPALTIGRLLNESILPGQRLRLLKTDMEGMDQPVLHQMLDHYQSRTGSPTITGEYPCVVFFELGTYLGKAIKDDVLFTRFTAAGFKIYDGIVSERGESTLDNAMALNCLCSRDDFVVALNLLATGVYDVDTVLSAC